MAANMDFQHHKEKSQPSRILNNLEVNSLFSACDKTTNRGKHDLALLKTLLYLGLRVGELVALSFSSVVYEEDGQRVTALMGIHGTRVIKVPEETGTALQAWLYAKNQTGNNVGDSVFVRVLKNDQITRSPINSRQVRNIVARCGFDARLSPGKGHHRLTPTDLRRTCGRNAYDNGARLLDVQALLGHSKPISTARFIGVQINQNPNAAANFVNFSTYKS